MTAFLDSSWPYICVALWVVIAAGVLIANHRVQSAPVPVPPEPENVRWLPFLPPVSPSRRLFAEDPADWLADQPYEVRLTDTEVRLRFADIAMNEAGERL